MNLVLTAPSPNEIRANILTKQAELADVKEKIQINQIFITSHPDAYFFNMRKQQLEAEINALNQNLIYPLVFAPPANSVKVFLWEINKLLDSAKEVDKAFFDISKYPDYNIILNQRIKLKDIQKIDDEIPSENNIDASRLNFTLYMSLLEKQRVLTGQRKKLTVYDPQAITSLLRSIDGHLQAAEERARAATQPRLTRVR